MLFDKNVTVIIILAIITFGSGAVGRVTAARPKDLLFKPFVIKLFELFFVKWTENAIMKRRSRKLSMDMSHFMWKFGIIESARWLPYFAT